MKSIEALGAAGEVTGSAFVGKSNSGTKFLVDCGMFQEKRNDKRNKTLDIPGQEELKAIFITHSHLDHIGRLPLLHEVDAPIFMTLPTRDLAYISLKDADRITPGLYPQGSISNLFRKIQCAEYDKPISVDGLTATFRDAGHILGSASVEIQEKNGERTIFSGDLGNSPSRTVRPTTLIKQANTVVMETTYGNRNHPEEDPVEVITEAIERIKKTRGVLFIPVFAIDRTQIILNILKKLKKEKKLGNIPVYLDSPMAIQVTGKYEVHHQYLNDELREQHEPFNFQRLYKTAKPNQSKRIYQSRGAKIILAGAGMISGGRAAITHGPACLPDPKSVALFVGYPAEGTPSREIVEGNKQVLIGHEVVDIDATILHTSGLSAHADQQQLLNWLRHIRYGESMLRKVILVHGDEPVRKEFAKQIREQLEIENISLPKEREVVDLHQNN